MFQAPRGTTDLLPEEQKYWRYIESKAVALAGRYGFGRIDTPVFEDSDLFVRSVGQGTDIVEKEMYTFEDRGGDSVTLRPEGTAPVCRAYLEHGMHNLPQPVRMYYFCPVFRYERPQAGRFREHHQFGLEVLGDADPSVDAEVIELAWRLMLSLGLKALNLFINSIGDAECRPAYIDELRSYYSAHQARLCAECQTRLERNPLRLLDCKVETCRALGDAAPRSADHLCDACKEHWASLRRYLDTMDIPYQIDHRLVRGLDYYTRSVFEIQPVDGGAQST
ncbi:MAG: histidine--tRNA ligase, partial [Chloroflexi bacterium]|nr:histidine--tRNA ligase [Chloroflexota bacterium]